MTLAHDEASANACKVQAKVDEIKRELEAFKEQSIGGVEKKMKKVTTFFNCRILKTKQHLDNISRINFF